MTAKLKPRQAATVILLRRAASNGFEVFLTRRPDNMPFLGGMYCYPGGRVNKEDYVPAMIERCVGYDAKSSAQNHWRAIQPARQPSACGSPRCASCSRKSVCCWQSIAGPQSFRGRATGGTMSVKRERLIAKSLDFSALAEKRRTVLRS